MNVYKVQVSLLRTLTNLIKRHDMAANLIEHPQCYVWKIFGYTKLYRCQKVLNNIIVTNAHIRRYAYA